MYRSVGIRDSRASLQLGTSMWRLSWITFIFLPSTFIVGFFGMNVNVFKDNPDIKWFFIVIVPFVSLPSSPPIYPPPSTHTRARALISKRHSQGAIILLGWYILKHMLARHRRAPMERGFYETLFTELQDSSPNLWTRQGPKEYIRAGSWANRLKWRMIKRWTDEKVMAKPGDQEEPIGGWNRLKRLLIRKWSSQIEQELSRSRRNRKHSISSMSISDDLEMTGALSVGLGEAAGVLSAVGTVTVTDEHGNVNPIRCNTDGGGGALSATAAGKSNTAEAGGGIQISCIDAGSGIIVEERPNLTPQSSEVGVSFAIPPPFPPMQASTSNHGRKKEEEEGEEGKRGGGETKQNQPPSPPHSHPHSHLGHRSTV